MRDLIPILAGLVAGLLAAAFFAGCEGAFLALATPERGESGPDGRQPGSTGRLLMRPDRLQHGLALGQLLAVVWLSALAWALAMRLTGGLDAVGWLAASLATGLALVVVAELAPKALGLERAAAWSRAVGPLVTAWQAVLAPVISLLGAATRLTERLLPPASPAAVLTSEELRTIVAETTERSELELGERQMITSIFAFGETTVREVMTPRTDIVAIEVSTPWPEALERVRESEHSRVPVYEESLDQIVGLLYAKEVLAMVHGLVDLPPGLSDVLSEVTFVPEAKKIDDLLRQFQRERIHLAAVVDEYGGTAGIVTLEDILEELVGEIQDEYDREEPMVVPLESGVLMIDGRLDADDFNELTGSRLEAAGVETMGGLITRELGRVAEGGETVTIEDWMFEVEVVEGKRIVRLRAWPRDEDSGEETRELE